MPCHLHFHNKDTPPLIGAFHIHNGVFKAWNTGNLFTLKVFDSLNHPIFWQGEDAVKKAFNKVRIFPKDLFKDKIRRGTKETYCHSFGSKLRDPL